MPPSSDGRARILALEPWFGGSHRAFLERWSAHSRHAVEVVGLPARHWRWRMRSAAWQLARDLAEREPPDVLFVSDYLDLPALRGLLPATWARVPALAYFHENQVTFPPPPDGAQDPRDLHLAWTNVLTALSAEVVVFNSAFHRDDFARGCEELFAIWPKPSPRAELAAALERAHVVSPGIPLDALPLGAGAPEGAALRVAFPHRREHDKAPGAFLEAVRDALAGGARLELVLLGERYREQPAGVAELLEGLRDVILHDGFAPDRAGYAELLGGCDVVASTARHEFFGIAVVEALATGCTPLLPARLAYPEVVPAELHGEALYADDAGLRARLRELAADPAPLRAAQARRRWRAVAEPHDAPRTAAALDALAAAALAG